LLVMLAAACGTASASVVTLASYAAGTWNCATTIHDGGYTITLKATAVVTPTSSTTGAVAITIRYPQPIGRYKFSGEWSLAGTDVTVQWAKRAQGTAEATPVSLNAKQFRIKSGKGANAKWSKVTADRKARSVTFGFPLEPGGRPNQTMICRKA
jgi:hypothetical protein